MSSYWPAPCKETCGIMRESFMKSGNGDAATRTQGDIVPAEAVEGSMKWRPVSVPEWEKLRIAAQPECRKVDLLAAPDRSEALAMMAGCSTGRGLPPALRPRPRRLRDAEAHPEGLVRLVPRPDRRPSGRSPTVVGLRS